jgi:Ca2+-binding EF-hand superfamily protein
MAGRNSAPAAANAGQGAASIIGAAHGDGPHTFRPVPLEITDHEADQAFDFFDVSGEGTLSQADLKARLSIFYKDLPAKEYDLLIPGPNFTKQVRAAAQSARRGRSVSFPPPPASRVQTLRTILSYDTQRIYDPVRDAFAVYDPQGTGFADPAALRRIFEELGYGKITGEDLDVIIQCADADNDGKISLEDFRTLMTCSTSQVRGAGTRRASERGGRAGAGENVR